MRSQGQTSHDLPAIHDDHVCLGTPYDLDHQHFGIQCRPRKCVPIYNLSIKLNIMKIGGKLFKLQSKWYYLLIRLQSEKVDQGH